MREIARYDPDTGRQIFITTLWRVARGHVALQPHDDRIGEALFVSDTATECSLVTTRARESPQRLSAGQRDISPPPRSSSS